MESYTHATMSGASPLSTLASTTTSGTAGAGSAADGGLVRVLLRLPHAGAQDTQHTEQPSAAPETTTLWEVLPTMDLIEIQGRLTIPQELIDSARQEAREKGGGGGAESATGSSGSGGDESVVLPLGVITGDAIDEKRVTLAIDTLRVSGKRGSFYNQPLLVLQYAGTSVLADAADVGVDHEADEEEEEEEEEAVMLFSDWAAKHPEQMSMDYVYRTVPGDASAAPLAKKARTEGAEKKQTVVKDYVIVGKITDYIQLNSKPARMLT